MFRILSIAILITAITTSNLANACPFCSAVSQTFSEEMASMDVVAITKLQVEVAISRLNADDLQAEVPKSRFVIVKVIKGAAFVQVGDTFDTIYFGEANPNRSFLAMATDAPNLMWSTPLILSDRAKSYLLKIVGLDEGAARLSFFQDYLEDEDEMVARDAYDEFAKAPYKDVIELKSKMDRERLLSFIQNKNVPSNRRRLYFTMLGVCGTHADGKLLGKLMESKDRKDKAGLDALLACYMILMGEEGLNQIDELFLKNKQAEYADTYAAIMAIRFHGSETDVMPRSRLVKSLRHMLDRPELADLVIPDLARWEDWEIMPRLVKLFVNADESSSWVRVPVVNYLRACPHPLAKENIEKLKKVDADAVRRAMTFYPLAPEKKNKADQSKSSAATLDTSENLQLKNSEFEVSGPLTELTASLQSEAYASAADGIASEAQVRLKVDGPIKVAEVTNAPGNRERSTGLSRMTSSAMSVNTPNTMDQVEQLAEGGVNIWVMFGVTLVSGGLCFIAMRTILGVGGV